MMAKPKTTRLRDGTPVRVRMVEPEDNDLIRIGFEHLSDQSRYLRFLHPVARLSDQDLDAITKIRDHGHAACGAFDLTNEDDPEPIGLARYLRLPGRTAEAEFAIAVVDSHQLRGLGSLLLGIIARLAVGDGIETFIGIVHNSNSSMRTLLDQLDASERRLEPGVLEFRFRLHLDPALYPMTKAGEAFRWAYGLSEAKDTEVSAPMTAEDKA